MRAATELVVIFFLY